MKLKKISAVIIAAALICSMSGCGESGSSDSDKSSETAYLNVSEMFTDRDKEIDYDESECVKITLSKTSAKCSSDGVEISGSTVTISAEGTYILSGTLTNGMIIVDADKEDKIQLVLNGVDINCDTSAAIYVKQADKVFITLAADTKNALSNVDEFVAIDNNDIDAVIFSKDDLTINGQGSLTVNAKYGHGIVSKDDMVITGGTYSISSEKRGISGNDSIRIAEGSFAIDSGTDGLHAENTDDASLGYIYISDGDFNITSDTDGLDASSILQIDGGKFSITTGGGSENSSTNQDGTVNEKWGKWGGGRGGRDKMPYAMPDSMKLSVVPTASTETADTESTSSKGLKADSSIIINSGKITVDSSDDSVHSNGDIQITDGTIKLTSGDDGIHADSNLNISGGSVTVTKSYEGIEGQTIDVSGGTVDVTASDDGFNAAGGNDQSSTTNRPGRNNFASDESAYITISGGKINVNASGDGIDSNGNLTVSGGETYVSGPTSSGNASLDYSGNAVISGGTVIAAGTSGMAQNFGSNSTQGSMLVTVSSQSAKTAIELKDESGKTIASFTPTKAYNCVLVSCPDIKKGETYIMQCGDSKTSVTMDSLIYGNGGGMGGGMHSDRRPF